MIDPNPYEAPKAGSQVEPLTKTDIPHWLRFSCSALTVSGLIYVPTVIWLVTYPGFYIWIGWAYIAFGNNSTDKKWFWIVSLLWNIGMSIFVITETFDRVWVTIPGVHSILACLVSLLRLVQLFVAAKRPIA